MRKILIIISILLTTCLSGCVKNTNHILVDSYPLKYLVEKISGDTLDVSLTSSGEIIQLSQFQNRDLINNADLFFYVSGLDPYFIIYEPTMKKSKVKMVDLAYKGDYYQFQKYTINNFDNIAVLDSSPYYDNPMFDNINKYQNDPMVWMDVAGFIGIAKSVHDYLVQRYPNDKKLYDKNYLKLKKDLAKLDAEYQSFKDNNTNLKVATLMPDYGTWQRYLGLDIYPICLSKYGVVPNEEQLNYIIETLRNQDIRYIFKPEAMSLEMQEVYNKVKDTLNLEEIPMNNPVLLNQSQIDSNQDYLTIMYENLKQLERLGWHENNRYE